MNDRLVSIIIPSYDRQEYLSEMFSSIANQTYTKWEVIFVDDGSKKAEMTSQIVNNFKKENKNNAVILLRFEENHNVAVARNYAMRQAKGSYIAFLDSDDQWKKNHLQKLVDELASSSADFVCSQVEQVHFQTKQILSTPIPCVEDIQNFPESLCQRCFITTSSVLMNRTLLDTVGNFDEKLRSAEDYDYWFRCIDNKIRFHFVQEATCFYRKKDPTSLTSDTVGIRKAIVYVFEKNKYCRNISKESFLRGRIKQYIKLAKLLMNESPGEELVYFLKAWLLDVRDIKLFLYFLASIKKKILNRNLLARKHAI